MLIKGYSNVIYIGRFGGMLTIGGGARSSIRALTPSSRNGSGPGWGGQQLMAAQPPVAGIAGSGLGA